MTAFSFVLLIIVMALFCALVGAVDLGYRWGKRRAARHPESLGDKVDAVQTTVFSLLSLILAFVFSGAASRFDHRQNLVVEEANAISTAYSRVDLLPATTQGEIRALFRTYVRSRIVLFEHFQDEGGKSAEFAQSEMLLRDLCSKASMAALGTSNNAVTSLVNSSLSDMSGAAAARLHASRTHPPKIFYSVLFALILVAGFLAGSAMSAGSGRPWMHIFLYALVIAATMYVILDFEYPRYGVVRIEAADQSLADVLDGMK